jgi:hypothetical protein
MADVRLHRDDADGYLPGVCMVCGNDATGTKSKTMSWCPPWVGVLILAGVLPYAIVALVLTKRATIQAPFCDRHQGHWFNRNAIMWGSFFLLGLICIGSFILMAALSHGPQKQEDSAILGIVCFGGILLFLAWLITVIICQHTAIRPKEITDTHITLTNVSGGFADAVEDAKAEYRAKRRRRSERWDEEEEEMEDDERPRRSRPSSEEFERD